MGKDILQPGRPDENTSTNDSPFHQGERAVQERVGMREKIEGYGRRGIRDFMPDQHREFFARLPMFLIGVTDAQQRPWASVLFGEPGFVHSPDPKRLHVAMVPSVDDPSAASLRDGATIGGLGIEFDTRRRNRVNGKVALDPEGEGFSIRVDQSFGNCPKYIQARKPRLVRDPSLHDMPRAVRRFRSFDGIGAPTLKRADTFFIASQFDGDPEDGRHGVDMSHRGGPAGFLLQQNERTIVWPDYRGNFFFNTLGNIELDRRCGLLIPDFETGDTLQLTGTAEVLWNTRSDDPIFIGAERLVQFHLEEGIQISRALPFAWEFLGQARQFDRAIT